MQSSHWCLAPPPSAPRFRGEWSRCLEFDSLLGGVSSLHLGSGGGGCGDLDLVDHGGQERGSVTPATVVLDALFLGDDFASDEEFDVAVVLP